MKQRTSLGIVIHPAAPPGKCIKFRALITNSRGASSDVSDLERERLPARNEPAFPSLKNGNDYSLAAMTALPIIV